MTKTTKSPTIWSVPFVALMMANFFQSIVSFAAHTTLPVYAHALGASTAMVGFVSGGFAVTALLVRPFAGPAFDSYSRKRLYVAALGIIGMAFVVLIVVDNLVLLIVARLIQGVGIGCAGPLAISLASEYLPASKFSSGISIFTLFAVLCAGYRSCPGPFPCRQYGVPRHVPCMRQLDSDCDSQPRVCKGALSRGSSLCP